MISQLTSYGFLWWMVFILIALSVSLLLRFWGIFVGHFIIAGLVFYLDAQWIQSEMNKPGWDGTPDQDFAFYIGLLIRIVLINIFLLPASGLGWALSHLIFGLVSKSTLIQSDSK